MLVQLAGFVYSVTDLVTGLPIEGAHCILYAAINNEGDAVDAYTDSQGIAYLDAQWFVPRSWRVTKEGYISQWSNTVAYETIVALEPTTIIYTVNILAGTGGSTVPSGFLDVTPNTDLLVTAYPDAGYILDYWVYKGQNVGSGNPLIFLIDRDAITIAAVFRQTTDTLIETYRGIDIWRDVESLNLYFRYEGMRYEFSSNTPIENVRARIDELLGEPPPPTDTLIETYRDIDIMLEAVTANIYFDYEGMHYLFSPNTPIENVRTRIDELLYEPPPNGPPPEEWVVTRSIHLFDNVLLKAEWHDISKALSRTISNIDTAVLTGGRLDYTVKYTQGLPIAEDANIALEGMNIIHEALSKGETKSGSVDLTGLIGNEATFTISFPSSPGIWSEVMFDVWITFGFSEEPSVEPKTKDEIPDWTKWLILGAVGVFAMILLTRRGPQVIVVRK